MSGITDILFGSFGAFFQRLFAWHARLQESGFSPDTGVLIRNAILVALWLGSGFAAATIAENRGRSRLPHFLLGLLAPWIYPIVMSRLLPRLHEIIRDSQAEEEHAKSDPDEVPASHLKSTRAAEEEGLVADGSAPPEDLPAILDQAYFARIATDETGAVRGPFIFEFDDGRVLEVCRISSTMEQLVVVEVAQASGKPRTVRCPYNKITSCRLKTDWLQMGAPSLAPAAVRPPSKPPPAAEPPPTAAMLAAMVTDTSPTIHGEGTHSTVADSNQRYVLLAPGTIIGNARIIKELGRGGMAIVYRAQHTALDIAVAVKVLSCNVDEVDPEYSERFLREAKYAAQIKHDNVVAVMDAGRDHAKNCYYIVLEYISGGTVADVLRDNNAIDEENAVKIAIAVASALEVAAKHNIVHRDIKPANMMITDDGIIKVSDLGIAKQIEKTDDRHLTLANTIIGSPVYMSPEQINDFRAVDTRTDIYSLGVSLFHMLTGKPPYFGETHIATLTKVINDPVPNPRDLKPDLSPEVAEVCMTMMAKFPTDRYQTPTEVLVALFRLLGQ
jgi:tRNA A-37 threonylcarbamoyl transferase component Bud32